MAKPVLLIALGAVAGMVGAALSLGLVAVDGQALLRPLTALVAYPRATPASRSHPAGEAETPDDKGAFSFCLRKAGGDVERTLRDLIAYHDHAATLSLTDCLLNVEPERFCPPDGGAKAADAMEIYLWARDAARIATPPHGLADKIRLLDRSEEPAQADPFALSWSGPRDQALFERLKTLARDGYLDANAFGYSGRVELREALAGVKPQGQPCAGVARVE